MFSIKTSYNTTDIEIYILSYYISNPTCFYEIWFSLNLLFVLSVHLTYI